jgi:hypothetical protein
VQLLDDELINLIELIVHQGADVLHRMRSYLRGMAES